MTIKKTFFFIISLLFFSKIVAQKESSTCETLGKIKKLIEQTHYKPKPINDSLSAFVFLKFFEKIDPQKDIFLEYEFNSLKKHKFNIDNYINNNKCDFLDEIFTKYSQGINRKVQIIDKINKDDLVLNTNETIVFTKKEKTFFKTELDLIKFFKKRLAYEILFCKLPQKKYSLKI